MMETLFIVGALLLIPALILWGIYIFKWLAVRNSLTGFTFKKTFLFLLGWWIITMIISAPLNILILSDLPVPLPQLLNTAVGFAVFFLLLKKLAPITLLKSLKIYIIYSVIAMVVPLVIILAIRGFLFSPFIVSGVAMNPTFETGDYLVIKQFNNNFERGDIVIYRFEETKFLIQRIIALPGEEIRIEVGEVFVDGNLLDEPYVQGVTQWEEQGTTLGPNEYFLMGDNREHSSDSRKLGPVTSGRIFGEYLTRIDLVSP